MDTHATTGPVLASAATIALLHAIIPSHWLAFALVARAQRWTAARAVAVTALAGGGHVLVTIVLGLVVYALGQSALSRIPQYLERTSLSLVLAVLGAYLLVRTLVRREAGHVHHGPYCSRHGLSDHATDAAGHSVASSATIGALVVGMTLSPCLDMLPVFVAAAALPWTSLLLVCAVMFGVTLLGMCTLTWVSLRGLERLKAPWLERYEQAVVGAVLILLSLWLYFGHGHE